LLPCNEGNQNRAVSSGGTGTACFHPLVVIERGFWDLCTVYSRFRYVYPASVPVVGSTVTGSPLREIARATYFPGTRSFVSTASDTRFDVPLPFVTWLFAIMPIREFISIPVGGVPVSSLTSQNRFVPAGRLVVPVILNVFPVFLSPMGSNVMTALGRTGSDDGCAGEGCTGAATGPVATIVAVMRFFTVLLTRGGYLALLLLCGLRATGSPQDREGYEQDKTDGCWNEQVLSHSIHRIFLLLQGNKRPIYPGLWVELPGSALNVREIQPGHVHAGLTKGEVCVSILVPNLEI